MSHPKILIHICCAPDSTYCFQKLQPDYEVSGYFCNPNIYPQEEYQLRLAEAKKVACKLGFDFFEDSYPYPEWQKLARGLESEPEGGERCEICFKLRLERTAQFAKEKEFEYFTTTLTISPHKNSDLINKIGEEMSQKYGVKFLSENFKKNDGFKKSLELSRKLNLYRQKYCGCIYSIKTRT